jgi:outer membrane protein TolC
MLNRWFFIPFLFLLGIGFLPCRANRAEALTIDQAVSEANENSPDLQASFAQTEVARYGKTEALSYFIPHVEFQGDHYFDIKYQVLDVNFGGLNTEFPFVSPATIYALNMNWSIFNGFQDYDHLESAKLQSEASEEDLTWAKFSLNEDVRLAFMQVIANRQLESAYDENIRNLEAHAKQVDARLRAGTALEVDSLRVQVQLNNARSQKINAHDDVIIAEQRLAQLLGKTSDSRAVEGDLPIPDDDTAKRIETTDIQSRPDLRALNLRSEASEKSKSAAKNYWIPSLALVGQYSFYNNETYSLANTGEFRSAYQVGIELKWNIFDGLLSYARAGEAAAQAEVAIKKEQSAKLQAATDHANYQQEYRYQLTQYLAQAENLVRSKRSVELALAGQRAGTQRNIDVLDAELDLFNARSGVIEAELGAYTAKVNFEKAVGRNL